MRLYLALIVAAMSLSGCITSSMGRPFDAEARRQVRVNATTKEEVRRLFGEPDAVNSDPAGERWTYKYFKATTEFFAGTTVDVTPGQQLTFEFRNGVVATCDYEYVEVTTGIHAGQIKKRITDKCVAAEEPPRASTSKDDRPCMANYSVGGTVRNGQSFRSFQEFPNVTKAVAIERVTAIVVTSGYQLSSASKDLGVVSASRAHSSGKTIGLNVIVKDVAQGGVRVEAVYTFPGGLNITSVDGARPQLCQVLESATRN